MSEPHSLFGSLQSFDAGNGKSGLLYSLPALEQAGVGPISRLPVSIRLVLESVLRHADGKRVTEQNIKALAQWQPATPRTEEIPFVVARIVLQDFTGVPLLVDLAAMRSAVARLGRTHFQKSHPEPGRPFLLLGWPSFWRCVAVTASIAAVIERNSPLA